MLETFEDLGQPITPKDLADCLGVDPRTVKKYYRRWGGIEVSPGCVRFFENRIKEVLNAEFNAQTRQETLCRNCMGRRRARSYKMVSGCVAKVNASGHRVGKSGAQKAEEAIKDDPHGIFNH
jgi:hypothetical protein